ncbi:aminotransferase class IV, partial [Xanthomonadaceae bacterium JHOS43]|nr:aminotransferase class IV [Xanthomonadaceae bacterium JHOS43]
DASLRISIGAANFTARAMPSPARLEVLMLVDPPAPEIIAPVRLMSTLHSRYLPQLKHGGSFDVMHLRRQACIQGFDDALLLTDDGFVAEGATFNIGFFHHAALLW